MHPSDSPPRYSRNNFSPEECPDCHRSDAAFPQGENLLAGLSAVDGALVLTKRYRCEIALSHACWWIRAVRQLLGRKAANPAKCQQCYEITAPKTGFETTSR